MLFFLVSFLSFALLFSKSVSLQPLPSWAAETRLLSVLFWKKFVHLFLQCLKTSRLVVTAVLQNPSKMSMRKKVAEKPENPEEMSVLDLPELALECILSRLSPAGLCNMAGVCSSLKDRCRSDHLWEKHMREKWGRVIGDDARREWQWHVANGKGSLVDEKPRGLIGSLSCLWPLSWLKSKLDGSSKPRSSLPTDSIMSWYLALESGKFWFPAQVYNRENGHVGFMLSCYDAELCYDRRTDTFCARYPPHGRRTIVTEDGIQWDRIRAPPVETSAHDLHVSDCLNDLGPRDHFEIQWRKNKEFPYGWWYGIVGHLESCDGSELHCRCRNSDTVVLEFNQYAPGSRWRQTTVNRKGHREEGNETDGFYGGIRVLKGKEEISMWRQLWPTDILE